MNIRSNLSREAITAAYLEYRNDYLTPELWGEHHGLSEVEAVALLTVMRSIAYGANPDN